MVKVVEGGQCSATRARFSPGVRSGWHLVAAEAKDAPRPITIETAKTTKSFLKVPPLLTSLSPCSSVCLMSSVLASTHKLNSFTRIETADHSQGGSGMLGRGYAAGDFRETRFHVVGSIRYSGGKMSILHSAKVGAPLSRNSREVEA